MRIERVAGMIILLCMFVLPYHITHMDSNFLKKKYDLHNSPEVESAVEHEERKTGEKLPNDPEARIEAYLDRLQNIIEPAKLEGHPNFDRKERNLELLKKSIFRQFITKYEEIPENYWRAQERILRERGESGDWQNISEEEKEKIKHKQAEALLSDQEASLGHWVDYLANSDSGYIPNDLKYWIFRSISGLQEYDKDEKQFRKRTNGEVKQFPDLNQEALAYVIDSLKRKFSGQLPDWNYDIQPEQKQKFEQYLAQENFAKLYAWAVEQINPIPDHLLLVTDGVWKKYPQGGDYKSLAKSIQGKGTGWCTAGESTARKQIEEGDFYVFYSLDDEQNSTIPRVAIRMRGDEIAEVRGIAYKQNLDPYMGDVLAEKLEEFPDKETYLKKDKDMKHLTEIEKKIKANQELTKEDAIFLYEIDFKIEGFGYQKDPRIEEIRKQRNPEKDMLIVFDCEESQVAKNIESINKNTKAYLGPLVPGIFKAIQKYNIEHVYVSFPDRKIRIEELEIGGKTVDQLIHEMKEKGIYISDSAMDMLNSKDFTNSASPESLKLVRLKVSDMGFFPENYIQTTNKIYDRIKKLGLELCPDEVGPNYRLKYADQPMEENIYIGMKRIKNRVKIGVFTVHRWVGLRLDFIQDRPGWDAFHEFVFCFRPPTDGAGKL